MKTRRINGEFFSCTQRKRKKEIERKRKIEIVREKWWAQAYVRIAHTIAFDLFHFTVLKRRKAQLTQIISHTLRHRQK